MVNGLPLNDPKTERLYALAAWAAEDRLTTAGEIDLCLGVRVVRVTIVGLNGVSFTERTEDFPSEKIFAQIALAIAAAGNK